MVQNRFQNLPQWITVSDVPDRRLIRKQRSVPSVAIDSYNPGSSSAVPGPGAAAAAWAKIQV